MSSLTVLKCRHRFSSFPQTCRNACPIRLQGTPGNLLPRQRRSRLRKISLRIGTRPGPLLAKEPCFSKFIKKSLRDFTGNLPKYGFIHEETWKTVILFDKKCHFRDYSKWTKVVKFSSQSHVENGKKTVIFRCFSRTAKNIMKNSDFPCFSKPKSISLLWRHPRTWCPAKYYL